MPHISYSELKNWNFCPFYHKLVNIDKIKRFKGNEFTAFGTAIHTVCEKSLLKEIKTAERENVFIDEFFKELKKLPKEIRDSLEEHLVEDMSAQGKYIVAELDEAINEYFEEFEVVATEQKLFEPVKEYLKKEYDFKGYIDLVIKTPDGKHHIIDWKTCSWGWDARRKADPMTTYQLTLYKHYYAQKENIDPKNVETHFALMKRIAKKKRIEFFRVTSGPKRTQNALNLLTRALYNINQGNRIKNRLSCRKCEFYKTSDCP